MGQSPLKGGNDKNVNSRLKGEEIRQDNPSSKRSDTKKELILTSRREDEVGLALSHRGDSYFPLP